MVQAARLLGIVLIIQSCYTGESSPVGSAINVTIDVDYSRPKSFDRYPPNYRAGTPLRLICNPNNVDPEFRAFYHWTSDCLEGCFAKNELPEDGIIETRFLRSIDSGIHNCTIKGSNEARGSEIINVTVVGAGIYDASRKVALPNNSFILDKENLDFNCVSGSRDSEVGDVFDSKVRNITSSMKDPFFTFQRTTGAIHVKSSERLQRDQQGIYSCYIPDERPGSNVTVLVGLYRTDTNLKLAAKMETKAEKVGEYIVNCTSMNSPATNVTWWKDGDILDTSDREGMYYSYQEVKDYNRLSSTYHNVLTIRRDDATGLYRCDIENDNTTTYAMTRIGSIKITGNENPLIVGVEHYLHCTTFVNATFMKMYREGLSAMIASGDPPNLSLRLQPNDTKLNNTIFYCKVLTPDGEELVEQGRILVREFMNNVSTSGSSGTWHTDNEDYNYNLTCDVSTELVTPEVMWLDPDGNKVVEDNERTLNKIVSGKNVTLKLKFNKLYSSHAGRYICVSNASDSVDPPSVNTSDFNVTIQLPRPIVDVTFQPENTIHFTGFGLKLKCTSRINETVDTGVTVNHTWYKKSSRWARPIEIKNSSRVTALPVMGDRPEFYSILQFSWLQKNDESYYYCKSTVFSSPDDPNLLKNESDSSEKLVKISPILKTEIVIDYNPPDLYAPPNYRAASFVTLNCTTKGELGRVYYYWSSNCSSCFVSGSRLMVPRLDFLRTRDMGNHTCRATDSSKSGTSIGSDSIHVNIVGAGIYVEKAQSYYEMQRAQPNNTHINIYSDPYSNGTNSLRFKLWCCSNSTGNYVGSITDPNGITYTSHFKDLRVYRHSRGSSYRGCIRLEASRHYRYPLNYDSGVYTCTIPDASGKNHTISFGLYNNDTRNVPSISRFYHEMDNPTSVLTLFCETRTAPPTEITWLKDGVELAVGVRQKTQRVTDRNSSSYISTISIYDTLDGHVATYTVIVGNSHDSVQENHTVEGIKITPSEGEIDNGTYYGDLSDPVTFDCSSDLSPMKIRWYNETDMLNETDGSSGHAMIKIISTNHHQEEYTCEAFSSMESQVAKFEVRVKVPPKKWGTVKIDDLDREPLHDHNHTLTCIVTAEPGLYYVPEVHWYHRDGSQVLADEDERVREEGSQETTGLVTTGLVTKRKLYFSPVLHDDGGIYTCRAEVSVPWMDTEVLNGSHNVIVTTQANMQLRIEALTHCSTWQRYKADSLEKEILKNIQDVVRKGCGCDFNSSEIHSGEFSCRTKRDAVTYRAIINGSSAILHNATEIRDIIDEWKMTEGTMRYHKFRLQLTSTCRIDFKTFSDVECTGDEERACDKRKGDQLFNSETCYTFKSCEDGSDDGSA